MKLVGRILRGFGSVETQVGTEPVSPIISVVNNSNGTATVTITESTASSSNAIWTAPYSSTGALSFTLQDTVTGDDSAILTLSAGVYVFQVISTKDDLSSNSNIVIRGVSASVIVPTYNDEMVVSSILNWFSENYAGSADWGSPDEFDPESEAMTEWVTLSVVTIAESARRGVGKHMGKLRLTVQCWSRDRENAVGAMSIASAIKTLLDHKVIAVQDWDSVDQDTVGYAILLEPQIKDMDTEEDSWDAKLVTCDALVREI